MLLALTVCLLATNVSAATPEVCPCCGKSFDACNWQPWTVTQGGTSNTLTSDGHYYLTGDITSVTAQIRIGDSTLMPKVTLDLRGHTIASAQRVFGVYPGATLSILDTVGGGTVEGKQCSTAQVGGTIRVNEGATLNLYSGTVRDAAADVHNANGAVIATEGKNVTINVAGGNVIGGTTAPCGGAIFAARGATVNVSAGTVTGGEAHQGGAIYLSNATLNLTGGKIVGGRATTEGAQDTATAGLGGAVYATGSSTLNLTGGEILGGEAFYGGAVFATDKANITLDGATVTGSDVESGGAFALRCAYLTVKSGEIRGGKVQQYGSAIHLFKDEENAEPCTVTVTGGTVSAHANGGAAAISMAANAHKVTVSGGKIIGAGKPNSGGAALSGQGTGATITITGGEITGAASVSTQRSALVYSRGIVNISGGEFAVTGDGPVVYAYQRYGSLTIQTNAAPGLSGKVFLEDNAKINCGYGVLQFQSSVDQGLWYYTNAQALSDYKDGYFLRPMGNATLNLSGKTVMLDVNGKALTVKNGSFYGFDTANDAFNAAKCGAVTLEDTAKCLGDNWIAPNGSYYLPIQANGALSFHRFYMAIEHVTLRTEPDKEGLFFNSYFAGDTVVKEKVRSFGIALSKQDLKTSAAWLDAMADGTAAYSVYAADSFQAGIALEKQTPQNGTLLKNIINYTNSVSVNVDNTKTIVYGVPYLYTTDGKCIMGAQRQTCMYDLLDYANTNYKDLSEGQRAGLLLMYERMMDTMNALPSANILASFDDEILAARRYTVYHAMEKMNDILWTVDKEVTFSISASSKGVETDLANQQAKEDYNPLDDDIITFYPDRIYKGLPYTHASMNNDSIYALGTPDEHYVYHLSDATPALFNGGSTNGSNATTGAYNISRIGNDCWDMVYWAWSRVSNTVTADQTNQMTPSFGVEIIGYDLLEKAMQDNGTIDEGTSMLDYICTKSTASATKDKYIYKSIPDTEPNGTIDGTRMVRYGTRTKNADGTYDYQALYQTYAMMQKGDALVRWRNGNGHAIMCGGIDVVYTSDGRIDGTKSTMIMLEQGSGHEERQSRLESEFSASVTKKHSSHTTYNKSCTYCAGYTDEVIDGKHVWRLDYAPRPVTFESLMTADYIPVTCAELNDTQPGEAPAVSTSGITNNISSLYNGTVNSNYRISKVELRIYDENGDLVNTSAIFGIQNGVRSPLYLNRFALEFGLGVQAGTPAIQKSGTALTAPTLAAGNYTYELVATLGYGRSFSVRTGKFTVNANGSVV